MPSPSVAVLDPASDANFAELARLVKVYSFPDFVKKADLEETARGPCPIGAFADPRNKLYRCHTAAATWLSGLYFQEKQAEFHPKDRERIRERLEHYVDYFRIRGDYDGLCKQAADLHKEAALPDSAYAYLWVDQETGHKTRHLPMRSAQEVKAAADWLYQYQERLPFHDRNTIARRVLEKAASFGAAIDVFHTDFLEKQAGMGVCDPEEVYKLILQRSRLASVPEHKAELVKLAETVKSKPRAALQPEQLVKLAVTLDMADRAIGLKADSYNEIIRRPEDVIFAATFTKIAADRAELCPLTTGNVYAREQFTKLSRDAVESYFGTDFANEVCSGLQVDGEKMAELAHTLPRDSAEDLDRLMAAEGLHPQMQKAASVGHGLSNDELEALAAAYEVPA